MWHHKSPQQPTSQQHQMGHCPLHVEHIPQTLSGKVFHVPLPFSNQLITFLYSLSIFLSRALTIVMVLSPLYDMMDASQSTSPGRPSHLLNRTGNVFWKQQTFLWYVVEGKVDTPINFPILVYFLWGSQHGHIFPSYRILSHSPTFLI